jgi:hypothetical protein
MHRREIALVDNGIHRVSGVSDPRGDRLQAILDADYLTGTFLQDKLPDTQTRTDELPMNLAIVDFPES